jgi:hypothetical protein
MESLLKEIRTYLFFIVVLVSAAVGVLIGVFAKEPDLQAPLHLLQGLLATLGL